MANCAEPGGLSISVDFLARLGAEAKATTRGWMKAAKGLTVGSLGLAEIASTAELGVSAWQQDRSLADKGAGQLMPQQGILIAA
jgi:hypothetical protein